MANRLVDAIRDWFDTKEDDTEKPTKPAEPAATELSRVKAVNWLKAWQLLKNIDFRVVWRVLPLWLILLVLCVTGLITWVLGILAVISKLINIAIK